MLDFHVVADEEVIEDAIFPLKFKSLSPNLSLPLSEMLSQTSPASCQNDASDDIREVSTMRRKSTRANMTIVEELECINEVVRRQVTFLQKKFHVFKLQSSNWPIFPKLFSFTLGSFLFVTPHSPPPPPPPPVRYASPSSRARAITYSESLCKNMSRPSGGATNLRPLSFGGGGGGGHKRKRSPHFRSFYTKKFN